MESSCTDKGEVLSHGRAEICVRAAATVVVAWIALLCTAFSRQPQGGSTIYGVVRDAQTNSPIENAIAYLSGTPLGGSTSQDGRFHLTGVPAGLYELVVSRVGYEGRRLRLKVAQGDSTRYDLALEPRTILSSEVEIVGKALEVRPAHAAHQFMFYPRNAPNLYCLYGVGYSSPVGIEITDSALYMYSLDTAVVDSERYLRLWLLYRNLSNVPHEINPATFGRLKMRRATFSYAPIPPENPSSLLTRLNNSEEADAVRRRIGEPLERMASHQKWDRTIEENFILANGGRVWGRGITEKETLEGTSGEALFNIFNSSVNDGVLRKHLVYPANGVHGYLYFPYPGLNWSTASRRGPHPWEFSYTLEIFDLPGRTSIEFAVH